MYYYLACAHNVSDINLYASLRPPPAAFSRDKMIGSPQHALSADGQSGRHRGSEGLAAARALHTCKGDIVKSPFPSKLSRVQWVIEEANPTGLCRPRR